MSALEKWARDYCLSIGADPDEIVWGYWGCDRGRNWTSAPRWCWYR